MGTAQSPLGEQAGRPTYLQIVRFRRDAAAKRVFTAAQEAIFGTECDLSVYNLRFNGERISTAFTESTINQVVSKRLVKKQQMQWTPAGAHLLLQVRTQVLNDDWEGTFRSWYPRFRPVQTPVTATLEAA